MNKIGVLGAGTMGVGIVQAFASRGLVVVMRDIEQSFVDKGLATINKNLARLVANGKLEAAARDDLLARIEATTEVAALAECDLVVEAAVENMAIKKTIFAALKSSK